MLHVAAHPQHDGAFTHRKKNMSKVNKLHKKYPEAKAFFVLEKNNKIFIANKKLSKKQFKINRITTNHLLEV